MILNPNRTCFVLFFSTRWVAEVLALTVGPKLAAVGFGEGLPAKPAKLKSLKPAK